MCSSSLILENERKRACRSGRREKESSSIRKNGVLGEKREQGALGLGRVGNEMGFKFYVLFSISEK